MSQMHLRVTGATCPDCGGNHGESSGHPRTWEEHVRRVMRERGLPRHIAERIVGGHSSGAPDGYIAAVERSLPENAYRHVEGGNSKAPDGWRAALRGGR
jgi:hypothetical protein